MEFWLSNNDAPGPVKSSEKTSSPPPIDTPPGPPTPEKHVNMSEDDSQHNTEEVSLVFIFTTPFYP